MGRTLVEKIMLAHTDQETVRPGETVLVKCDLVMANDVTGPVAFRALDEMEAPTVFDAEKVVLVSDHFTPAKDARSALLHQIMQRFAEKHGVTYYSQGRGGIEHAVLVEDGWVVPGMVVVGGDSHTCTHGALGAFGTGLGSTDIAGCLAFGEYWESVPATIRVGLTGTKARFVTGKDVILALIDRLGVAGGLNSVFEFTGEGVSGISIDERLAISNMAVEAGADSGIFPADEVTEQYLRGRTEKPWEVFSSDEDAEFRATESFELGDLPPLISKPHSPGNISSLADTLGVHVDQVYIGNCANGTMTDLRQTYEILHGQKIHPRTRAIIVPASQQIYREALAEGLLDSFVEAGAIVSTPSCGACFGGGMGVLASGETAVATTNRNFRGRMGSPEASVYLANAYVAAAAAVAGEIVDPAEVLS